VMMVTCHCGCSASNLLTLLMYLLLAAGCMSRWIQHFSSSGTSSEKR
jgi:hypothetical protein